MIKYILDPENNDVRLEYTAENVQSLASQISYLVSMVYLELVGNNPAAAILFRETFIKGMGTGSPVWEQHKVNE